MCWIWHTRTGQHFVLSVTQTYQNTQVYTNSIKASKNTHAEEERQQLREGKRTATATTTVKKTDYNFPKCFYSKLRYTSPHSPTNRHSLTFWTNLCPLCLSFTFSFYLYLFSNAPQTCLCVCILVISIMNMEIWLLCGFWRKFVSIIIPFHFYPHIHNTQPRIAS